MECKPKDLPSLPFPQKSTALSLPTLANLIIIVGLVGIAPHVIRFEAIWYVAMVQNAHTFWDWSNLKFVGYAVSSLPFTIPTNATITNSSVASPNHTQRR